MSKRLLSFSFFLFLFLQLGFSQVIYHKNYENLKREVRVIVTDMDIIPINKVKVYCDSFLVTETDIGGRYKFFTDSKTTSISLIFDKRFYKRKEIQIQLEGFISSKVCLALDSIELLGVVIDNNGDPIPGALIYIGGFIASTTSSTGAFRLNIPAFIFEEDYYMFFLKDGYEPISVLLSSVKERNLEVTLLKAMLTNNKKIYRMNSWVLILFALSFVGAGVAKKVKTTKTEENRRKRIVKKPSPKEEKK